MNRAWRQYWRQFGVPRGDCVQMRGRLSVMMFMEYFISGAWYVTLGTWLGQQLHLSGQAIDLAMGTTALGVSRLSTRTSAQLVRRPPELFGPLPRQTYEGSARRATQIRR
jgi:hypothetical protein